MEVRNCSNDRQYVYNSTIYLCKFPRNDVTHRSSTNRRSISINLWGGGIKRVDILEKSHLNMLLLLITTVDTYKSICISILINKQNNDKLNIKILLPSIGNYITFISSDKRTVL